MKLVKLETQEQFDKLKNNDLVIVRWGDGSSELRKGVEVGHYSLVNIKPIDNEIILRKRDNVYFNINMYLRGKSGAREAYVLELAS